MRRQNGAELQLRKNLRRATYAHLFGEASVGAGKLVGRVVLGVFADCPFARAQRFDAIMLFAEVHEMEVRGKRAGDQLRVLDGEGLYQAHGIFETVGGGRACVLVLRSACFLDVRFDRVCHERVEFREDVLVVFREDLAQRAQEQVHALAQDGRHFLVVGALRAECVHGGDRVRYHLRDGLLALRLLCAFGHGVPFYKGEGTIIGSIHGERSSGAPTAACTAGKGG